MSEDGPAAPDRADVYDCIARLLDVTPEARPPFDFAYVKRRVREEFA